MPAQIAHAVAVGVLERARVDLIDHRVAPPVHPTDDSPRCGRRDSNPHGLRHGHLKPACLPISPRPRRGIVGAERDRLPPIDARPPPVAVGSAAEEPCQTPFSQHPNRDKPESKATKAIIVLLLLATAGLVAIVTFGGWSVLQGAQPVAFAYILVLLVMAYYVYNWNRGVLPVAAALATLFTVLALVAAPAWFARDKAGFTDPTLEPSILGLLTVILIPVQLLLLLSRCAASSSSGTSSSRSAATTAKRPVRHRRPPTPARALLRPPARSLPRCSAAPCPGGGTGLRAALKRLCLARDMWVRIPPRALPQNDRGPATSRPPTLARSSCGYAAGAGAGSFMAV